jgi:hypothetical protein
VPGYSRFLKQSPFDRHRTPTGPARAFDASDSLCRLLALGQASIPPPES